MSDHAAIQEAIVAARAAGAGKVVLAAADLEALFDELVTLRALVAPKRTKRNEYPPEFEDVWAAYPPRAGANKVSAFKAWAARIKSGVEPGEILAGVRRYAAYVTAERTEERFIKQPATFFGPDEHFATKWPMPRQQQAQARTRKFDPIAHINKPRNEGGDWDGIIDITPR